MAFGWDTPATVVPYVESLAAHVRVGRDALVDEVARQHPGPSGDLPLVGSPRCVIRRKTDTGSGAKRTTFRSYPDKVPAESGHLT